MLHVLPTSHSFVYFGCKDENKEDSSNGQEGEKAGNASTNASGSAGNSTNSSAQNTTVPSKPKIVKVALPFTAVARDAVAADADELTASLNKLRVFNVRYSIEKGSK